MLGTFSRQTNCSWMNMFETRYASFPCPIVDIGHATCPDKRGIWQMPWAEKEMLTFSKHLTSPPPPRYGLFFLCRVCFVVYANMFFCSPIRVLFDWFVDWPHLCHWQTSSSACGIWIGIDCARWLVEFVLFSYGAGVHWETGKMTNNLNFTFTWKFTVLGKTYTHKTILHLCVCSSSSLDSGSMLHSRREW